MTREGIIGATDEKNRVSFLAYKKINLTTFRLVSGRLSFAANDTRFSK
jgi:hypothetical protein